MRKGRLYLTDDRHACRRNHSGRHNRIYHRSRGVGVSENYGVNDHRIHPLVKIEICQNWYDVSKMVRRTSLYDFDCHHDHVDDASRDSKDHQIHCHYHRSPFYVRSKIQSASGM